jgi:hypothetical protein
MQKSALYERGLFTSIPENRDESDAKRPIHRNLRPEKDTCYRLGRRCDNCWLFPCVKTSTAPHNGLLADYGASVDLVGNNSDCAIAHFWDGSPLGDPDRLPFHRRTETGPNMIWRQAHLLNGCRWQIHPFGPFQWAPPKPAANAISRSSGRYLVHMEPITKLLLSRLGFGCTNCASQFGGSEPSSSP